MITVGTYDFNGKTVDIDFDIEHRIFVATIGGKIYDDISYLGLVFKIKNIVEQQITLKWIRAVEFEKADSDANQSWDIYECWIAFHPYEKKAYRTYDDPVTSYITKDGSYKIRTDKKSLPFSALDSEYIEFNQELFVKLNAWSSVIYRLRQASSIDVALSLAQKYLKGVTGIDSE